MARTSQRALARIAHGLKPGQYRAVSTGIYLTVDSRGRMRFQYRARHAGAGSRHAGGTFDSLAEAEAARQRLLGLRATGGLLARRDQERRLTIAEYASREWWPHVVTLSPVTQVEYRAVLERDILPFWKGWRIGDLVDAEDMLSEYVSWLKRSKSATDRGGSTAPLKALSIFTRLIDHAVERQVLGYNPVARTRRQLARESAGGARVRRDGIRRVLHREVRSPIDIERIRIAMGGRTREQTLANRARVSLAGWEGLRPGEIGALRHRDWRSSEGPLSHILVGKALKDVAGHLMVGPTKNGRVREVLLWPRIAQELEQLYDAQGAPPLDALVFPNSKGGYSDWGNWRTNRWYQALKRAGLAERAAPGASGAFDPYSLRHTCATLMFYVRSEDEHTFADTEIAEHLGHTGAVLHEYYAGVRKDMRRYSGQTMDQVIATVRREVWGPAPGEPDYVEELLGVADAARLCGISEKAMLGRIANGTVEALRDGRRLQVRRFELVPLILSSGSG